MVATVFEEVTAGFIARQTHTAYDEVLTRLEQMNAEPVRKVNGVAHYKREDVLPLLAGREPDDSPRH